MTITFIEKQNGYVEVVQDITLIALIRYSRIEGHLITYIDEPVLDIKEQKTVLKKMIELQKEAKAVREAFFSGAQNGVKKT